jgi:hypothetical protein
MKRDLTILKARPSSSQILARMLEIPDLAEAVRELPAPALAKVIDAVGLEDAGEIVAFASPAQLAELFDEDLWRSERAGDDERFDGKRFLVWLDVMMEAGDAFVADRLANLPEDLVALALHQHLMVLNVDDMLAEVRAMDEQEGTAIEKALQGFQSEELDDYLLVARRPDGWDTVLAVVLALDRDHHAQLSRVLDRLTAMTTEHVEREGGLYTVLTSEEMLESDVAADREDRRAELGHVAPSDARAFLKLARPTIADLPTEHDPLTRAWFRGLAKDRKAARAEKRASSASGAKETTGAAALSRVLVEAGVVAPAGAPPLLGQGPQRESLLVRTMRALAENDADAFAARSEEIAYLANVLVAGASNEGRRYRPAEAVQRALEVCNRGLELASTKRDALAILRNHPAEALFRLGGPL